MELELGLVLLEAVAEVPRREPRVEGAATGSEFSVARLQMSALRNIGDCNEAIGDAAIALKYARAHVNLGERDTDRTVVADGAGQEWFNVAST